MLINLYSYILIFLYEEDDDDDSDKVVNDSSQGNE